MRTTLAVPALSIALGLASIAPSIAEAQAADRALTSLDAIHAACRGADDGEAAHLYSMTVEGSWRFDERDEDFLPVDTRHNLRALAGSVELLPSHMEMIGFVANDARVTELQAARTAGARLRVGFFLGFDDPDRSSCLIRPRAAVTLVRMDVAFVEVIDATGALVAREDTERYRSWQDDEDRAGIPGTGPRAAVGSASLSDGTAVPDGWTRAIRTAGSGALARTLGRCHAAGLLRGASPDATIRVRLHVEGRTGHVTESSVEIANVGDTDEVDCIVDAVAHVDLPAGSGDVAGRAVDLSIPVTLAD
jgi:hypothetical protein